MCILAFSGLTEYGNKVELATQNQGRLLMSHLDARNDEVPESLS